MIVEVIGWTGTFLIVLAYYLVTSEKLKPTSDTYDWMNLTGAIFIATNVFSNQAYPALALQLAWGFVAISGLVKNYSRRRKRSKSKLNSNKNIKELDTELGQAD